MTQKTHSIDDIGEAISLLGTSMDQGFIELKEQFADLANRMDVAEDLTRRLEANQREFEANQREANEHLKNIEGNQHAIEDDVKELYRMIDALRLDFTNFDKKERERFANLEHFARRVARKTKVPFSVI